jgi:predicted transcriptional regulator
MVIGTGATPPHTALMPSDYRVSVSLAPAVKERLQDLAALMGASESAIGERAITQWMEENYTALQAFYLKK